MKILLCICGSISAYKSIDIARGLVNKGYSVKVVLTRGALQFVLPQIFTYLGVEEVYLDDADFKNKNVLHIELARWCDTQVIAPLSANTLSRLARGEASDLLTSVFLALDPKKSVLIFPAMNTLMLNHPFTKENFSEVKKLKTLDNVFISNTNSGILACNEVGSGKLLKVEEILELIPTLKAPFNNTLPRKKIVITTGATISPLDPVRYLTNSSSGITGFHLAVAALKRGHEVSMIAGKNAVAELDLLVHHPNYKLTRVTTVTEMYNEVHSQIENADAYLSAAAISDIEFEINQSKIKKEAMTESLKVKKAIDILDSVIKTKKEKLKIVGFAAETDLTNNVLQAKYNSKPVDLLIGTLVNNAMTSNAELQGFNLDHAEYRIMEKNTISDLTSLSKTELAETIFQKLNLN